MTWVLRVIAIILVLTGLVWLGQGLNIIPGSFMTGSGFWAMAGAVCIIVGGFLGYLGFTRGTKPRV